MSHRKRRSASAMRDRATPGRGGLAGPSGVGPQAGDAARTHRSRAASARQTGATRPGSDSARFEAARDGSDSARSEAARDGLETPPPGAIHPDSEAQPGDAPSRFARPKVALLVALLVVAVAAIGVGAFFFADGGRDRRGEAAVSTLRLEDIPFNGERAYEHLKELCAIGPRPSGSQGMAKQQELLAGHFRKLGGQVEFQRFRVRHPLDGSPVELVNLIVRWRPESKERILLGTHYDTLPYPMLDKDDPWGTFVGGNDGGSGVAVLMELGQEIPKLKSRYGIDFVFFDAEEFVFRPDGRHFLGSEHFAREYVNDPQRPYRYRWGVVLDMVGDKDLQIYQERHSVWWKDSKPLVDEVWRVAARLGVREFIARPKYRILDDHLALHDVARIPSILLIDYDYPYWHTQADAPDKCSALSLAKVGWVVLEWLKQVK